jgi:hypothetical protein
MLTSVILKSYTYHHLSLRSWYCFSIEAKESLEAIHVADYAH